MFSTEQVRHQKNAKVWYNNSFRGRISGLNGLVQLRGLGRRTMLTEQQEKFIASLLPEAIAHVQRYDPQTMTVAGDFCEDLQKSLPYAAIHYFGSTRLGISGENDIDIGIIAGERVVAYLSTLTSRFGEPYISEHGAVYRWKITNQKFPIDVFLVEKPTERIQESLDTQQILEARGDLRTQFEKIKQSCNGKSLRDYTRAKFEFFNTVLHPHMENSS